MVNRYERMTQEEIVALATAAPVVALLPVGAIENHGPHLPVGTDALIAEALADRAARLAGDGALLLPPITVGVSHEHVADGATPQATLSVEAQALIGEANAIAGGLACAGIGRLLFINGHGGNVPALNIAALDARRHHGMLCANAHWLDFGLSEGINPPGGIAEDIHGGWLETSLMLALDPGLVKSGKARANPPETRRGALLFPAGPVSWGWKTGDIAPGGWIGWPERASRELGTRLLDHATAKLAELIADMAAAKDFRRG
jgi:creatinine amidohydrolase